MIKSTYITSIDQINQLTPQARSALAPVCDAYAFRTNDYYLSLIDWDDPRDPIRRIVIPTPGELEQEGSLDPSGEHSYQKVPGLEHKYEHIALLLVNEVCGGFCRFCFRKRLFMPDNDEVARDVSPGLDYIRSHPEINNVLITGGDPLLLSTSRLRAIVSELRTIDHVRIIRIGSKMPAFNPYRILNDPALVDLFREYSLPDRQMYLMTHFNHPRELTDPAVEAIGMLRQAGAVIMNQTPLIHGVNDDPAVLADLFNRLTFNGILPYYVFQCRPTRGNHHLAVPVESAFEIHEQAKMNVSGLGKLSRFVMSHTLGKIQVLGMTGERIYLKFHRSADFGQKAKILVYRRNPEAYWFSDYTEPIDEYRHENPFTGFDITDEDETMLAF